jgi:hypothetical protein
VVPGGDGRADEWAHPEDPLQSQTQQMNDNWLLLVCTDVRRLNGSIGAKHDDDFKYWWFVAPRSYWCREQL